MLSANSYLAATIYQVSNFYHKEFLISNFKIWADIFMPEIFPHSITSDIQAVLDQNPSVAKLWASLTPLSQNEWICWITFFKKEETHLSHLERLKQDLINGKRRPCCWMGCPHRPGHPKKVYTARKKLN